MLDLNKDVNPPEEQLPQMFAGVILPKWENEMLYEQSFNLLEFKDLKRIGSERNEYNVYINENEFKTIEAATVTLAISASEIAKPFKVVNVHARMKDIIPLAELEYVEKNIETVVETKEETTNGSAASAQPAEAAEATVENPPETTEPPPQQP